MRHGPPQRASGSELALSGSLVWSSEALGWIADWHLPVDGKAYHWGMRGVSFDAAFGDALGGAAEILSGHGGPG